MGTRLLFRSVARAFMALCLLVGMPEAWADVSVVVSAKSGINHLSREDVVYIFMGRYRTLSDGSPAYPVDLPGNEGAKGAFYRLLVGRDLEQIATYWSRLVFTGQTSPPRQAGSVEGMIRFVAANRGGIGYLDSRDVDARVRVVLELKQPVP